MTKWEEIDSKALVQRDLIEKHLTQKQNGTKRGFFVRCRTNDSSLRGKSKSMSKLRVPNKAKTCHFYKLKEHIKKDCWKFKRMQREKESKDSTFGDASYINDSDDGGALVVTHAYKGDRE